MNDRLASSQERLGSVPERHRLIRKLESIADLTTDDKEALLALPMTVLFIVAEVIAHILDRRKARRGTGDAMSRDRALRGLSDAEDA